MTVSDLIAILETQDPKARVVLYDHTASRQPAVSSLGVSEVQPIALCGEEEFGVLWLKIAERGPVNGVVLGPQYPPNSCTIPVVRRTTPVSSISFETEEAKQDYIARQREERLGNIVIAVLVMLMTVAVVSGIVTILYEVLRR
jgi:hypothetical protein